MEVRREAFGSEGYRACLELRRVVLREPLGLDWSEADLAEEEREWQFGGWEGDEVVACLSARWLGEKRVKLRQMAVGLNRQGAGLGRNLVEEILEILAREGAEEVELHAREPVLEFYEKLGFEAVGERFVEVGLPHRRMKRQI
jgi:predicted GNAT family N-acyltransferase